jgi:AmmeMemoRadiSam system protein A
VAYIHALIACRISTAPRGHSRESIFAWLQWLQRSRRSVITSLFLLPLLAGFGCDGRGEGSAQRSQTNLPEKSAEAPRRVREPAVSGLFYPAQASALSKTIDDMLESTEPRFLPRLRALVCPHAGYEYSGRTAACAYKTLAGREIRTVLILAPSHYADFAGASVSDTDAYRTPLGLVPVSEKAKALASVAPFVLEPRCLVERPGWWMQAPKKAPEPGQDTPDTWEHSAEVQVPFLQRVLKDFKIIPVVFGQVDPEEAAKGLAGVIDATTLIVASSDLSHYHPYDQAKALDTRCVKAICDLDIDTMRTQEACGKLPILTLMRVARLKGWKTQLLDYRNSGDVTGEKERVVGYASIAFYEPAPETFVPPERKLLLELARKTLVSVTTNGSAPVVKPEDLPPKLTAARGCFVTLTERGVLRGCIGNIIAQGPLWDAVIDNARSAALRDPRFPPVSAEEVPEIKIEISVLTPPQPLTFASPEDLLAKLTPYEDGVVLKIGTRGATFLPQVWAQLPDKTDFLSHLSVKAGCAPADWRGKETTVSVYHVEAFEEPEAAAHRN